MAVVALRPDHDADKPKLSESEAADMGALGVRFAEFTPEASRYRLSIPYRTLHNLDRQTLTFTQEPFGASVRLARRQADPSGEWQSRETGG
jgi:hypothetical protein